MTRPPAASSCSEAGTGGTWTWDGSNWTRLDPSSSPSLRYSAVMDFVPANGAPVLFGGSGIESGPPGDTWTWTGTTWNEVHAANNPAPRRNAAAAYDPASAQQVMFGGLVDGYKCNSETWGWNGRTWSHLEPNSSPRQRSGEAEAFGRRHRPIPLVRQSRQLHLPEGHLDLAVVALSGGRSVPASSAEEQSQLEEQSQQRRIGPRGVATLRRPHRSNGPGSRETSAWTWNTDDWADPGCR